MTLVFSGVQWVLRAFIFYYGSNAILLVSVYKMQLGH